MKISNKCGGSLTSSIRAKKVTELYPVTFNEHKWQPEDAVLALIRNETHNYGVLFVLGEGAKCLNENLTLSPQTKTILNFVEAKFRTAYNLTEPQLERLFTEKKFQ